MINGAQFAVNVHSLWLMAKWSALTNLGGGLISSIRLYVRVGVGIALNTECVNTWLSSSRSILAVNVIHTACADVAKWSSLIHLGGGLTWYIRFCVSSSQRTSLWNGLHTCNRNHGKWREHRTCRCGHVAMKRRGIEFKVFCMQCSRHVERDSYTKVIEWLAPFHWGVLNRYSSSQCMIWQL